MVWINVLFILMLIFLLIFVYSFIERYWVQIKQYNIKVNQTSFHGFKIVFLSDFHLSSIVTKKYIKKIVQKTNDLKPDLIILGGDYISNGIKYVDSIFQILKTLNAKNGVFGVLGNHDVKVSKVEVLKSMKKAGINSLDNESYWIYIGNERIKIGGVSDYLYDKPNKNKTLYDVNSNDFVILTSHNPDFIDKIKYDKVDLMLSGHTHGGQVTMFGRYPPCFPSSFNKRYLTGYKTINNIKLIVTNGVGVVGLPIRFFARPQIVLIELER